MGEASQRLSRRDAGQMLAQRISHQFAHFLFAVEEQVFLPRKVIEHGHAANVGNRRDLVDGDRVESFLDEELRRRVGDALARDEPLAGTAIDILAKAIQQGTRPPERTTTESFSIPALDTLAPRKSQPTPLPLPVRGPFTPSKP